MGAFAACDAKSLHSSPSREFSGIGEPVVGNKWNELGDRRFRERSLLVLIGMALGDFPVPKLSLGSYGV